MKKHILLVAVFAAALLFNSCKKDDDDNSSNPTVTPTTIELTINDESGAVPGASVKLYSSETDLNNQTNQIGEAETSNASGVVSFGDLNNIQYYWFAEKDCQNNVNGIVSSSTAITANATNTYTIDLTPIGTMKLVSTSSNPYEVFINNVKVFNMDGGTTQTIENVPTGSYSVRVLQISGYVFSPTDNTYSENVNCGQTTTVTFP